MDSKMLAPRRLLVIVPLVLLVIAALSPLSRAAQTMRTSPQAIRRDVELSTLHNAMKAFEAGQYKKAKDGFEVLSYFAENATIRRKALFGLAATRMVLADSEESLNRAVAVWEKWAAEAKPCKGMEDPRMLTPFLQRLQSAIWLGAAGELPGENAPKDNSRGLVLMKEKTVQDLRVRLEIAERQIRRLQHDLKSLDEIHRKYEEKKQEMTP